MNRSQRAVKPTRPKKFVPAQHLKIEMQCGIVGCVSDFATWVMSYDFNVANTAPHIAIAAVAAGPALLRSVAPHWFQCNGGNDYDTWIVGDDNSTVACRLLQAAPGAVNAISLNGYRCNAARVLDAARQTQQLRSLRLSSLQEEDDTAAITAVLKTAGPTTLRRATLEFCETTPELLAALKACVYLEALDWKAEPLENLVRDIIPATASALLRQVTLDVAGDSEQFAGIAAALPNLRRLCIEDDDHRGTADSRTWERELALLLPRLEALELQDVVIIAVRTLINVLKNSTPGSLLTLRSVSINPHRICTLDAALLRLLADRAPMVESLTLSCVKPEHFALPPLFTHCRSLTLKRLPIMTDEDLAQVLAAMPQLRSLESWNMNTLNTNTLTFDPVVYATYHGALGHQLRDLGLRTDWNAATWRRVMAILPRIRRLRYLDG